MAFNSKILGGVLLIVGNAIGGGMLALPVIAAQTGFMYSTLFLVLCWALMVASALLLLEVNLWFPANSHLISMAQATLGKPGAALAWVTYLFLLYALLAAYIAGGTDFSRALFQSMHVVISPWLGTLLFSITLIPIVYQGIRSVDYANRCLMGIKLGIYLLLILLILPFVSFKQLATTSQLHYLPAGLTVMITSFGFSAIVPSLRSYFHGHVNQLRWTIILGSLIPLVCYIVWNLTVLGSIPYQGDHGLAAILHSPHASSDLMSSLTFSLKKNGIITLAWLFSVVCLGTSFLGVGLSLVDFVSDGFGLDHVGQEKIISHAITFLPPLALVLFFPAVFISALNYAGISCTVLLALMPALMVWRGRYKKNIASGYQVWGGRVLPLLIMVFSTVILVDACSRAVSSLA